MLADAVGVCAGQIKADRNETGNAEEDIEKLQEKTTELANEKKL